MFTLEDEHNSCLAGKDDEIAVGSNRGHVTVYNTSDWSVKSVLAPPTRAEDESTIVNTIQYTQMKKIILLVRCHFKNDYKFHFISGQLLQWW